MRINAPSFAVADARSGREGYKVEEIEAYPFFQSHVQLCHLCHLGARLNNKRAKPIS
jgi:hypothetical protein